MINRLSTDKAFLFGTFLRIPRTAVRPTCNRYKFCEDNYRISYIQTYKKSLTLDIYI